MKLRTKIICAFTTIQGLLFVAIFAWVMQLTGGALKNKIIDTIMLSAETSALMIESKMTKIAQTTTGIANTVNLLKKRGQTDRNFVASLCTDTLTNDSDLFTIWAIFEPNAWDGKDAQFAGTNEYGKTGRFYPWAYRDEQGKPVLDLMMPEDGEETGPYYSIPFESGKPLYLEPYVENIEKKPVLMTTYSIPLMSLEGKPYGVAGIDISLSFLSSILAESHIEGTTDIEIISSEGLILGTTGDPSLLGQAISDTENEGETERIIGVSQSGKASVAEVTWGTELIPIVRISVPIRLPGYGKPWVYTIGIKKAVVYRDQITTLISLSLFFLASIIILTIGIFFLSKQIANPIQNVSAAFLKMENGDLTIRVPITTKDEVGALAKAFNLFSIRISFLFQSVKDMTLGISNASVNLEESVAKSKNAVTEIRTRASQTERAMGLQVAAIDSARGHVSSITGKIDGLYTLRGPLKTTPQKSKTVVKFKA